MYHTFVVVQVDRIAGGDDFSVGDPFDCVIKIALNGDGIRVLIHLDVGDNRRLIVVDDAVIGDGVSFPFGNVRAGIESAALHSLAYLVRIIGGQEHHIVAVAGGFV